MTAPAAGACCPACGRALATDWRLEFETGSLFLDGGRLAGTRLPIETRRGSGVLATVRPPHIL